LLRELLEIKAYANPANRVYLEVEEDPYGEPPSIHRYVPQHIQVLADPPLDVVGLNGNILAMGVLASVYGLGLGPEGWFWIDDEYFRPEFITSDQLRPRHFGDHPTYGSSMMRRGDSDDERDDDGSDEIRVEDYRVDDEVWGGMDAWAAYPPGVDDPFDGNMNEFEGEAGTPAPPRMESMSDNEENLIGNLEEKKSEENPREMESSSSTNFVGENCHVMGVGQSLGSSPNHIGDETRMEDDEFRRGWRTPRGTWGTPHLMMG
jgi:hypothetical protein